MVDKIKEKIRSFSRSLGESGPALRRRLEAYDRMRESSGTVFRHGLNIVTRFDADWTKMSLFRPGGFEISRPEFLSEEDGVSYDFLDADNRFVSMNSAFLNSSVVIRIPKNEDAGSIRIKAGSSGDLFSSVFIIAEEGSRAVVFNDASGQSSYAGCTVQIVARQNSKVKFCSVQRLNRSKSFFWKKAVVGRDAEVEWLDISAGGSVSRNETYSELRGRGSRTGMFNVFFGFGNQQFDFFNKCVHLGRDSESLMLSSGALQESSKAINQAFAKITDRAFGSMAHQKAKILLLSEHARASPIPKLEIDNNDVSASHEASVGQIESEKIFYLMSRGLDAGEARKVYVEGFFEQYLSQIEVREIREGVEKIVSERMGS